MAKNAAKRAVKKTVKKAGKKAVSKKRTSKKAAGRPAPARAVEHGEGMPVPAQGVRVRMYRHGFGDCFLLSFGRGDAAPFHMVIDCGLLPGAPGDDRIRAAVADIRAATGGRVDVLVCTHEHADHLSGFMHAQKEWDEIAIGELWFAWTEDPADADATRLREQRERRLAGLAMTEKRLRAAGRAGWAAAASQEVAAALTFFGAAGVGSKTSTAAALAYVRERVARPKYFEPGDTVTARGLEGVRFFVLGPPREEKMLKKDKPSSSHPEVYHAHGAGAAASAGLALTADAAFFAAVGGPMAVGGCEDDARTCAARSTPFDDAFRIPRELVASAKTGDDEANYLHRLYEASTRQEGESSLVGDRVISRTPQELEQSWRRIDDDWLGAAGSMALKLDSDTNNTSLVLAIELGRTGQVLLFPGDAQVGSWLSWDSCAWQAEAVGAEGSTGARRVTTPDLLARTVLYKVGHHGSHNATLKERGLERMTDRRLVAMVPVDEEVAAGQGTHGWKMPFAPLLGALRERTSGRVLRLDKGMPERGGAKPAEWEWFEKTVAETDLYLDYVVKDAAPA